MHVVTVTAYWWQGWGRNSSLLSLRPGPCIWHFGKPEKSCLGSHLFPIAGSEVFVIHGLPSLSYVFSPVIISNESLVIFATSSVPCLPWNICFRVVEIGRSRRLWWGCVQPHRLQRCFDGLVLFSFLSAERSQTVAEVPGSEGMEPFPDSCILLACLKPLT